MVRIRVETNRLRDTSREVQQVSEQLRALDGRLGGAIGRLDWQVRGQANIDGRSNDARSRARSLCSQAEELSRRLSGAAQAFEDADRAGVGAVGTVSQAFVSAQQGWMLGRGSTYLLDTELVDANLRLGELVREIPEAARQAEVDELATRAKQLKTIALVGRTKIRDAFPYLLPFTVDLRTNPFRRIKAGTGGAFLIDTALNFLARPEDWNVRGLAVAGTKTLIDGFIFWKVRVANAVLQLGGSAAIWGTTELGKAFAVDAMQIEALNQSSAKAQGALEKIDLGRVTRSVAELVVDYNVARFESISRASRDLWQQPSVGNLLKLGLLTTPGVSDAAMMLVDPEARAKIMDNVQAVGDALVDLPVGAWELGGALVEHGATVGTVVQSGIMERVRRACADTGVLARSAAM
jgi:uncharacterized protein YukE